MIHYPHQQLCQAAIVSSPLLAALSVALRLYARWRSRIRLHADDWAIIAALVCALALIGPSWRHVQIWHVGRHVWQIPRQQLFPNDKDSYAVLLGFQLLYVPILPLVKTSMVLLLLRLGAVLTWTRRLLWLLMAFTIASGAIPWCICIFVCPPRAGKVWAPRTFGNLHCLSRSGYGYLLIFLGASNLLTDILIFPIPFMIVRRLTHVNLKSRLILLSVFLCSLIVTAIGAAKLGLAIKSLVHPQVVKDWTYNIQYCLNHIECGVAIIMANVPVLHGLFAQRTYKVSPNIDKFRLTLSADDNASSPYSTSFRDKRHTLRITVPDQQELSPFRSAGLDEEQLKSPASLSSARPPSTPNDRRPTSPTLALYHQVHVSTTVSEGQNRSSAG